MKAQSSGLPIQSKILAAVTVVIGVVILTVSLSNWQSRDPVRFGCYLGIAMLASGLKLQLPGIDSSISLNFVFILLGVLELSLPETLVIGCAANVVQSVWKEKRVDLFKLLFNFGTVAIAIAVAYFSYDSLSLRFGAGRLIVIIISALVFFLANTLPIAIIIALTEGKSSGKVWSECYFWSFPYYLVGAVIVAFAGVVNRTVGWETSLLVLPLFYWVYRSYRLYLARLEAEKERVEVENRHVEQVAALNMRTIEALALAIEAKDHTTHAHLQRLRTYSTEIGRELKLDEVEIEALRAAALLHDIGKLAVPEQIINKPGRLTPEEFEKMKVHPLVGAEILERVAFPYPVAPIVRSHHERWDGSGYPEGLAGENIPIGARILAAVDCLDALASHRQYRQALPLAEAMDKVKEKAGSWFDPKVVDILLKSYVDLERQAQMTEETLVSHGLSKMVRVERGLAPATGFERSEPTHSTGDNADFLTSIASARQEAQTMFELSQDLGASLSLSETLSVLSMRLRRMIPYDSIAVFVNRNGWLLPELVSGENFRMLSSLKVRVGEGLCGWVAANSKPIVNGNPQVEAGYTVDPGKHSTLQSALVVPLEGLNGVVGVLAMYHANRDAFTPDHLRILLAVASKVALSVENALKYQQVETSATTDYLTGLPNAHALSLHLAREISRSQRLAVRFAIVVFEIRTTESSRAVDYYKRMSDMLRTTSETMKALLAKDEFLARVGDKEFVGVFSTGCADDAFRRANAICTKVSEGESMPIFQAVLAVLGISVFPEDGKNAESLMEAAYSKGELVIPIRVNYLDEGREKTRVLKVFLCHSSTDKQVVRVIFNRLCADGIDAWLDETKLFPGQDWKSEIRKAVRASDAVIVCLSKRSVTREGFVQAELKYALDVAEEKPQGTIYLIPLLLEECEVPEALQQRHWVSYSNENWYNDLWKALALRAALISNV